MTIHETRNERNLIHLNITLSTDEFDTHFIRCADCGKILLKENTIDLDGHSYCEDCIFICDHCGGIHPLMHVRHVEDSSANYCEYCYNEETYICDDCGNHFRYSGSLEQGNDGNEYCSDCIENYRDIIDSYHTFKNYGNIVFHGNEDRTATPFMGFELEVDGSSDINCNAAVSHLRNKFDDFFHYEEDGSLNHGWENISQPASLAYHLNQLDAYEEMFQFLQNEGLRSHDTKTCGFHIHIDRAYFADREDTAIAKLLYIFEKFRKELMIFSRRTDSESDNWARSRKSSLEQKNWIKDALKASKDFPDYQTRYYAVNLTNSETVEIRLWKGTLNIETFEATLELSKKTDLLGRIAYPLTYITAVYHRHAQIKIIHLI